MGRRNFWLHRTGGNRTRNEAENTKGHLLAIFLLISLGVLTFPPAPSLSDASAPALARPGSAKAFAVSKPLAVKQYANLPLSFEANLGQSDARVRFLSRGPGYTLFLTSKEAVLALRKPRPKAPDSDGIPHPVLGQPEAAATALGIQLVGANANPRIEALEQLPGRSNYFIGKDPKKWRTNVPSYARVKYHSIYPGVDLMYYWNQRQLEHDFIVAPGADPRLIALGFKGAKKLRIDASRDLLLETRDGVVRLRSPVMYQQLDGDRREVPGGYVVKKNGQVGFWLAPYDESRALVIDPVLSFSTYLGGSGHEGPAVIGLDSAENIYVAAHTASPTLATTVGSLQGALAGGLDVFVAKFNNTGSALIYLTYLGGSGNEIILGGGMAVNPAGNVYLTGNTSSNNFPITSGAFQPALGSAPDAFVAKLNSTGSALIYSTYLGGTGTDSGIRIAVDSTGNAYVGGIINGGNFPVTSGAFRTVYEGGFSEGFVAKVNASGSALVYSTYFGGTSSAVLGVAVDATGNAYLVGWTFGNFPTTPGAFQSTFFQSASCGTPFNCSHVFVAKLNATGSGLIYSTLLAGNREEAGFAVAIDADGNAYAAGHTASTDFPTTPGALQTTYSGSGPSTPFVTKLNPAGTALVFSTYLEAKLVTM